MTVADRESTPWVLTFSEALERAASNRPARALWDGVRWRTWRDYLLQAERTAGALYRHGLRSGDVLATQLPNCWELVVLHAAAARLGVLFLPLHSAYGTHEVQSLIEQSGASALVARGSYRGRDRVKDILAVRDRSPSLRHVWVSHGSGWSHPAAVGAANSAQLLDGPPSGVVELPAAPADPWAPLVLLASSGTTSQRPKLCIHSHAGLIGNAAAVAADGGFDESDTVVSASPMSHAFGLLSLHLAMVVGGGVGLAEGWSSQGFLAMLQASAATAMFAVPAHLHDLLRSVEAGGPDVLGSVALREVRTGGAPVPRELVDAVGRTLRARVVVQWGMTEVGAGTYTRPDDPPSATSTIGRPVTGGQARVVRPDGSASGPGEAGELQFRSPYLFLGYLGAPELTRSAFTADGWLRTGDLACVNPDLSVSYRGRADEQINRGGLKFSALEVEALLADLPQLAQYAVVGRPDPRLGQRSCLLVALRAGASLTLGEVTGHLTRKGLATYKLPEHLEIVDRLPTTVTGKIARARLDVRAAADT